MLLSRMLTRNGLLGIGLLAAAPALAESTAPAIGRPTAWGMAMQPGVGPVHAKMDSFHDLLLVVIAAITLVVMGLLAYTMVRYRKGANPVPSKMTHNTTIEIVWTAVPVLILLVIVFPSFRLMYYADVTHKPEMTLKAIGHQWYWGYAYPSQEIEEYASNLVPDDKIQKDQLRLLSVDYPVVLPVDTDVQILTEGADVIHAFSVPSFGVKKDAMPGRTNETWVRIDREGTYYGQCDQICGQNHAYMPIEVRAVSKDTFKRWADMAKADGVEQANTKVLGMDYAYLTKKTSDAAPAGATGSAVAQR